MTATLAPAPLAHDLAGISLAELDERADRQTRTDRKYVVPLERLAALIDDLEPGARVLDIDGRRVFGYRSVYYDTPELTAYLAAAHRRRRRYKVRSRTYLDSGSSWVEVKTRGPRGATVKHRLPRCAGDGPLAQGDDLLSQDDTWFASEVLELPELLDLRPTLASRFERTTVHLPATESRLTIDTDLVWTAIRTGGPDRALTGLAVVETKTGATASSADRALWRAGLRPVRISKYCTGMAALDAGLPATPWRRTLDRFVLPHLVALPAAP